MTRTRTHHLSDFEPIASEGFAGWIAESNVSLLVTHTNKVLSIGLDQADGLRVEHMSAGQTRGLALDSAGDLHLVSGSTLVSFANTVNDGERSERGADIHFAARHSRFIGGVVAADMQFARLDTSGAPAPVFASVTLSAVCTIDPHFSARVVWTPPWITALRDETRCRLTGLGLRDGELAAVTSASKSDEMDGWETQQRSGGVLVDTATGDDLAAGLSLPHSPRWIDGRWWLLQAGTGDVGFVESGRFETVHRLDGFVRGMAQVGEHIVVGTSGSRWGEIVHGLPIGDRLNATGTRPIQGLFVINTRTGALVESLRLEGTAREIGDVVAVPDARLIHLTSPTSPEAQDHVTVPAQWQRD